MTFTGNVVGFERDHRARLYASYVTGHQGEIEEQRSAAALEAIAALVIADPAEPVLDVGCGQGQLIAILQTRGHRNVRGIDLSQQQVALAHDLGRANVAVADLFAFAGDHAGAFGVVCALDVVEHFDRPNVLGLFTTLRSMLRPGGQLILRTPNATSPYHGRPLYGDLTHGTAYTSRSMEQIAAATGFQCVRCLPSRPAGRGLKQVLRRVLWRLFELGAIAPLIVETGVLRGHIVTQNLLCVMER